MSEHTDFEELEQIPWASLAANTGDPRLRLVAIGVLAALAIAVVGWLLVRNGSPADAVVTVTEPVAAPATITTYPITTTPPETTVYTEADLMLIDVTDEERLAALHAEWLVRDYLTVDEDPQVASRIDHLLPGVARSDSATYVEWAAPIAITSPEPGSYRVEILYCILTAGAEGFVRQPAGALAVELSIDVDGTARLQTAPEEVSVPPVIGLAP